MRHSCSFSSRRYEHAKAKAEKRATYAAALAAATDGPQAAAAARKFATRHIAIPASRLGGSSQSTPAGSPSKRGPLAAEAGGDAGGPRPAAAPANGSSPPPEFTDVPPVWQVRGQPGWRGRWHAVGGCQAQGTACSRLECPAAVRLDVPAQRQHPPLPLPPRAHAPHPWAVLSCCRAFRRPRRPQTLAPAPRSSCGGSWRRRGGRRPPRPLPGSRARAAPPRRLPCWQTWRRRRGRAATHGRWSALWWPVR